MTDEIKHNGTVSGIDGQMVDVTIIQMSSCVGCQAKSLCRLSEMKDKTVSVAVDNSGIILSDSRLWWQVRSVKV